MWSTCAALLAVAAAQLLGEHTAVTSYFSSPLREKSGPVFSFTAATELFK